MSESCHSGIVPPVLPLSAIPDFHSDHASPGAALRGAVDAEGRGGPWGEQRQAPRSVTTGGKNLSREDQGSLAHIDWLSFTLTPPEEDGAAWFWPYLNQLFGITHMERIERLGKWNGYDTVFDLGGHGLLGFGGKEQRGTLHVSLSGSGCAHIADWQAVQDFLESRGARITRVDLAHDDFEGDAVNMESAVGWYHAGLFKSGGRNPAHRIEGDWLDPGSPKGRTLYIGRKANGKLCCIYEKGKQLGEASSPWTRVEVRLGGKSRSIPLDVLTRPGVYLAGSYPQALGFLSAVQEKIRTVAKVALLSLEAVIHYTRLTVGKVINLLCVIHRGDDSKVVEALRRGGIPKRLENYADFLPAVLSGGENAALVG